MFEGCEGIKIYFIVMIGGGVGWVDYVLFVFN